MPKLGRSGTTNDGSTAEHFQSELISRLPTILQTISNSFEMKSSKLMLENSTIISFHYKIIDKISRTRILRY